MIRCGRHTKAVVAWPLAEAVELGLGVEEVYRGHRQGVVVCPASGARMAIWSIPRVSEDLAGRIQRIIAAHMHKAPQRSEDLAVMTIHQFDLVIARALVDDEIDALVEAGLDDASPEIDAKTTTVHVDRAEESLAAAIVGAVLDVESAGLTVAGIGAPDLVDLPEIAARTGRTRESIRLLALGRRGPGGFPTASHGFYSWAEVRAWFAEYDPSSVGSPSAAALSYDRTIGAADHLVRARALLGGHGGSLAALVAA